LSLAARSPFRQPASNTLTSSVSDATCASVENTPEDYYLKSLRNGTAELLRKPVSVTGNLNLDVVLSSKGGLLEGTVVNAGGQHLPAARILLAPIEDVARVDVYRMATADAAGRFSIRDVTPVEYQAFAFAATAEQLGLYPDYVAFLPGDVQSAFPSSLASLLML
jgi:hypothetical protein